MIWNREFGASAMEMKINSGQSEDCIQSGTSLPAAGRSIDLRQLGVEHSRRRKYPKTKNPALEKQDSNDKKYPNRKLF
jgi:hypothetical protein